MKKSILAVGLASFGMVSLAHADMPNLAGRYFINPSFGTYITDSTRHQSNAGVYGLAAGYNFNQIFSAQVAFSGVAGSYNGYYGRVEGLFNIPVDQLPVVPYLAAGVGALKVDNIGFAVDVGAGAKYYISNNLGLTFGYRHVIQTNRGVYHDDMFDVGFVYTFGGASPALTTVQPHGLTAKQQKLFAQAKKTLRYVLPNGVEQCGVNGATPQDGCITIEGNKVTMHLDIKFQKNVANVRGQFAPAIIRLSKFMNTYPSTKATLYGYASSEGPAGFNQRLSLKRADQVKNYLVTKQNIASSRIKTVGMGTQNPIASNASEAGRVKNRRVEAAVTVPMQTK